MNNIDERVALRRAAGVYRDLELEDRISFILTPKNNKKTFSEKLAESRQRMIDSYRKLAEVSEDNIFLTLVTVHPNGREVSCSDEYHELFTELDDASSGEAYERYASELDKERIREGPTSYHSL